MSHKQSKGVYRGQVDAATRAMHVAWKPIPGDVPPDEYTEYARRVVSLLEGGADDVEIADYLGEVEQSAMGLATGSRDLLEVARTIRVAVAASSNRAT